MDPVSHEEPGQIQAVKLSLYVSILSAASSPGISQAPGADTAQTLPWALLIMCSKGGGKYICQWRKYLCVSLETCWDGPTSPGALQGRGEFQ